MAEPSQRTLERRARNKAVRLAKAAGMDIRFVGLEQIAASAARLDTTNRVYESKAIAKLPNPVVSDNVGETFGRLRLFPPNLPPPADADDAYPGWVAGP